MIPSEEVRQTVQGWVKVSDSKKPQLEQKIISIGSECFSCELRAGFIHSRTLSRFTFGFRVDSWRRTSLPGDASAFTLQNQLVLKVIVRHMWNT